jgi:ribosomal protein L9
LDKSLNNALLAKAVEVVASKGERWLMYGRIGNHPSLDRFKKNNGFIKYSIARYYIPLTTKGKAAVKLGLHRDLKDTLPEPLKNTFIPAVNFVSRTHVKLKQQVRGG